MSDGSSERKRAAKAQERANELAQERLQFHQDQMAEYENTYGGLEAQLLAQAERGAQADYGFVAGQAAADTEQAMNQQREQQRREMMAYGLDPTSGRYQGMERQMGTQEAAAEAASVTGARRGAHQQAQRRTDQMRSNAMNLGQNRFQAAYSGIDSAHQGLQQQKASEAQMYRQQAQAEEQALGSAIGTVGGAAAGFAIGGPGGAMMGAQMGNQMGGSVAGGQPAGGANQAQYWAAQGNTNNAGTNYNGFGLNTYAPSNGEYSSPRGYQWTSRNQRLGLR